MLRAIIKHTIRDAVSEAVWTGFKTVDFDAPLLEAALGSGGGETGYDINSLVGVEILPEPAP